jgi:bifunctional UDP-N-acetylglucosamine pyrophosphorylase / glucosamine-1-phosphate N-acetyltransferase
MPHLNVLILAVESERSLNSYRAKLLHPLIGMPMISHVFRAALALEPDKIIVVSGYESDRVRRSIVELATRLTAQGIGINSELLFAACNPEPGGLEEQLHSLLPPLTGTVLVLSADMPLIRSETLRLLLDRHKHGNYEVTALTTASIAASYQSANSMTTSSTSAQSSDQSDTTRGTSDAPAIGIACFKIGTFLDQLSQSRPSLQGLSDLTPLLPPAPRVHLTFSASSDELLKINSCIDLARCAQKLRRNVLERLMLQGVTVVDPESTYISHEVVIGTDTLIHPQVIIDGSSSLGANCEIHSWSHLINVQIGDRVLIKNCCVLDGASVRDGAQIGPFAHIRSNAEIGENAVIGNFVEVKHSQIGRNTKSKHLSYIGDATVGEGTNIGAGTITCNWDGKQRHRTLIGNNARIGADTMLVAPVRVGDRATTGAGSVVTRDVSPDSLVFGVPARVHPRSKS